MATYNFNGNVNGPANFGDNGTINIGRQDGAEQTLRLAAELARWLRAEGADQDRLDAARTLHGELEQAGREQRAAEPGVVRRALETITLGLGAGSTGLALAQEITRLLG
ncbi:hypothetical protein ACFXD5_00995 [Streptomyces sp. NPDC059385]|uniref:hypothetical protein n=1 Tax=Streptomyces sp. NPDC059385 TaxID=3346817 RepID=UPI0036B024D5